MLLLYRMLTAPVCLLKRKGMMDVSKLLVVNYLGD
jgi:hypothetical protein